MTIPSAAGAVSAAPVSAVSRPRANAFSSPSPLGGTAVAASLRKLRPPPKPDERVMVRFAFNPERITVSHMYTNSGVTGSSVDDNIKALGFLEIGIDKVYLIGPSTKSDADTLITWSCPVPAAAVGTAGQEARAEPVELEFAWGGQLTWEVRLRSVTVVFTRFEGATGNPIRAEVRLGMYSNITTKLPGSNPTSGGPPGRSGHVLDSSECLASLAAANYDRAGAWRMIARANAIDDPLRVAPGTAIYLPEPGELGNGAGGRP